MKKFMMALAATTMIVSPLAATQAEAATHRTVQKTQTVKYDGKHNGQTVTKTTTTKTKKTARQNDNRRYSNNDRQTTSKSNNRRWAKGQKFDRRYASNYRVVNNPRAYHLQNAPRGYQYVRSGNDAILVAITGGIIGAVFANAFN